MRAVTYDRTGPAREVLAINEIETPLAGPGEVRVKLAWSGVNPSDVKTRAGVRNPILPFPRVVPHSDGAGVIDQVGEGIDPKRIGQRVWTWNAAWGRADGTAAEYIALPARQAVPLPDRVADEVGACLGIPALTAWHAVHVDGGVKNKRLLVAGGAGAVGHYAVQMAKRAGAAQVIATVSGDEKAALAKVAGADVVINYRTSDLATAVMDATGGTGVDRIVEVDFGVNVAKDIAMIKPEGDIVVYGSGSPEIAVPFVPSILKNIRLRFFIVYNLSPADRESALIGLTSLLQEGALMHNIAARLPLNEAAAAHELVESGKAVGNVILRIE
jgi:NADPH2:quinone reductase